MKFYAVIIGTEILNARREDKHFAFLRSTLAQHGHELSASFVLKDDKELIKNTYRLIKNDPDSVMFSFGGIGSTPDDLTREIAAEVFTSSPLIRHKSFEKDIVERFGDEAYPHRIHMADLPQNAELIFNPINNMSGFSLEKRFFFTPGFPNMAHPMIQNIVKTLFHNPYKKYRLTLLADTSENALIDVMKLVPKDIELSSLPMFLNDKAAVELSLASTDETALKQCFKLFTEKLKNTNTDYKLI